MGAMGVYYRGGSSLKPRRSEVKIDSRTGLLRSTRGVSVQKTMANPQTKPGVRIIFPEGFDARWEAVLAEKGYIEDVVVELECGTRYALSFIDPTRLKQELELEARAGRPFYAVPNLVVLPEVTRAAIEQATPELVLENYLERLGTDPRVNTTVGRGN
jgi:hypothetical protein